MATYLELAQLSGQAGFDGLLAKISTACAIKAQAIAISASPPAPQVAWAKSALENPQSVARTVVNYVLAANQAATTTQILGATDATIQSAVNDAVDKLLSL